MRQFLRSCAALFYGEGENLAGELFRGNYLFTKGFKPITLLKGKYVVFLIKKLNEDNVFRMFRQDRLRIGQ